ncbi:His Kinase A (phospho-acceptor) domain-containing protein [Cyclonatronum proteinivorum]|uniref:histidine kinase n=1 Tax=Cyclonatronum proteinivorum TaxID=1457365 RepID=A0A345UIK0_9BACT|nr:sensor histidine kinase [Cyclonatronum proteinivorum]AXJ00302.1 His Kinase A (phospho-acceptor) domain-containing protein [Cyclonatronum proteinivorum]
MRYELIDHLISSLDLVAGKDIFFKELSKRLSDITDEIEFDRITLYDITYEQTSENPALGYFSQMLQWNDLGNIQEENVEASEIPVNPYFERWATLLSQNNVLYGPPDSFPEIEAEVLEAMGIKYVVIVPYLNRGQLEGFAAFERTRDKSEALWASSFHQDEFRLIGRWLFNLMKSRKQILQLENEKRLLAAQLDSKNQILANLSHEIRTPMNGIVGLAEQLEDLENDISKRSFLESIKLSSANLMEVLSDIAEFSTSEAETIQISTDQIDVRRDIKPIMELFRDKAVEKGLRFEADIDDDVPELIESDFVKIRNIIKNLTDNAIKFTSDGYVKSRLSFEQNENDHDYLILKVKDTGIGISKDKQDYVFEKYAQIEQGFTRTYSGIGLGLSIVKNTVNMLSGNIALESEPGKGCLFVIRIPVLTLKQAGTNKVSYESLENMRILVVDDHPINRKVVTTILDKWNAKYEIACNGREAVEIASKQQFDIILMDIQMPVMDGYDATVKIREVRGDQVTILALTASILKEDEKHCLEVGMNGIIRKPFFPDNLKKWLNNPNHENKEDTSDMAALNNETVTDLAYLNEISDGNKEFIDEMVNLFVDQSGGHIESLREGLRNSDYAVIAAAAHKLKPVLGYVGIDLEKSGIKQIETVSKSHGDFEMIEKLIDELEGLINKANDELNNYLAES